MALSDRLECRPKRVRLSSTGGEGGQDDERQVGESGEPERRVVRCSKTCARW